jgi:hypothetical protein
MLQNAHELGSAFVGHKIPVSCRLDSGPEAIATRMHAALAKVDLAGMVAAGTAERILDAWPHPPVPWPNFRAALCAIYLGRYDEATELLRDAVRYAQADGRPNYGDVIERAQTHLAEIDADPHALRSKLNEVMKYNWTHFKTVSKSPD